MKLKAAFLSTLPYLVAFSIGCVFIMFLDVSKFNASYFGVSAEEFFKINTNRISAITNLIIAFMAIAAFYKVNDYYRSKMKETGFELTKKIITDCGKFKLDASNLHLKIITLQHLFSYNKVSDDDYVNFLDDVITDFNRIKYKLDTIEIDLGNLSLWKISYNEEVFKKHNELSFIFILVAEAVINDFSNNYSLRISKWNKNKEIFKEKKDDLVNNHKSILIPFEELFGKI